MFKSILHKHKVNSAAYPVTFFIIIFSCTHFKDNFILCHWLFDNFYLGQKIKEIFL